MDPHDAAVGGGGSLRADPAAFDASSKSSELGTKDSRMQRAPVDQIAHNYTESQAAASTVGGADSHYRYRRRETAALNRDHPSRATPGGDTLDSMTESGFTTDNTSVYSYHSTRDLSNFVKELHGRIFNAQSELYVMPSDDIEFQRLTKQHYAFVLGLDGLFPCTDIVNEVLIPRPGNERPAVLDLGCGSGVWAIEMAIQFPDCDILGLDLAPTPIDLQVMPPNCRFEIDDINLGLSHYHEQFDVIHVRCVGSGISDFGKMMRDVEACLKPGGIVFFIDGEMKTYQEDMITPVPVGQEVEEGGNPNEGSWLHRITREMRYAAKIGGSDVEGLEDCIDKGMWDHELLDPSTVRVASMNTPIGIWAKSRDLDTQQRLLYAGSLIRQNVMGANRGWHPFLMKRGIPKDTLTTWSDRLDEELNNEKFRCSLRWRFTWGRRRATENVDPPLPTTTPNPVDDTVYASILAKHRAARSKGYRFLDVYETKEEAVAMANLRKLEAKDLPVPMVVRLQTSSQP